MLRKKSALIRANAMAKRQRRVPLFFAYPMKKLGTATNRVDPAVLVAIKELNPVFGLLELYTFEASCISVCKDITLQKDWSCSVFCLPRLRPRIVVLWEGAVGETVQSKAEAQLQGKMTACKVVVRSFAYHMLLYRLEHQRAEVIVHPRFATLGRTFSCPNPSKPRLHPVNAVPDVLSIKTGRSSTPLITTLPMVVAREEDTAVQADAVLTCIETAALLSASQGLEAEELERCIRLAKSYLCGTGTHVAGNGMVSVDVEEAEGLGRCTMLFGRCRNLLPLPLHVEGEDAKLQQVYLTLKVWKDGTFCNPSGTFALSSIAEQASDGTDPMDVDLPSTSNGGEYVDCSSSPAAAAPASTATASQPTEGNLCFVSYNSKHKKEQRWIHLLAFVQVALMGVGESFCKLWRQKKVEKGSLTSAHWNMLLQMQWLSMQPSHSALVCTGVLQFTSNCSTVKVSPVLPPVPADVNQLANACS
ncbi:hypothetical protein CBOM_02936 [Ceraceosorus bombacis]|uniref:Uncharacterized protein n=1 Tax=Ceraceosorus bombacis TaxID=401625 RepID=A0A0P1BH91_9BASI|nr:hypothetical protein CBOM_02936 [Ceraceosorus bombacis]